MPCFAGSTEEADSLAGIAGEKNKGVEEAEVRRGTEKYSRKELIAPL